MIKAKIDREVINPACVCVAPMYEVYRRCSNSEFMAEHINWDNLYARQL
jgi:hypothetical protein